MLVNSLATAAGLAPLDRQMAYLIPMNQLPELIISTLAFALIGILLFAIAFWLIVKISPFSIRKELEDDQNTALGIVIGSVILGIALIVAAAVHG